MALDGPDGDRTSDERPERIPRHSESGDVGSPAAKQPAEPRTRAEYYEARLAAEGGPAAERDELLALLEAMGMPTEPIGRLNVEG